MFLKSIFFYFYFSDRWNILLVKPFNPWQSSEYRSCSSELLQSNPISPTKSLSRSTKSSFSLNQKKLTWTWHNAWKMCFNIYYIFICEILGFLHWIQVIHHRFFFSHCENKWLWCHFMHCMQCPRFERNVFKNQRKCNKQKIQWLWFEYEIYFMSKRGFFFSIVQTMNENIFKILSRSRNKFHIQVKVIEFSVYCISFGFTTIDL